MSEMLANHYFLIRNFISAKSIYERILEKDSLNKSVKKKLTICYVTTGEVDKALNLFIKQIEDDIDFMIAADIRSDDCPCPGLISEIENQGKLYKNEIEKTVALGILWLCCGLEKSIEFFKKAEIIDPKEERFQAITSILINKLISNKQDSIN
jgi:tetratricopeptide (TPR) repeat protein